MRARVVLALLIVFEALALVALATRVPVPAPVEWSDPLGWLRRTDPETATLTLGRGLGIVLASWLLATTLAAVVVDASRVGAGRLGRLARWLTPALVRHVVEAAFAAGFAAVVVAPAVGATAIPTRAAPVAGPRTPVVPLAPVRDGRAAVITRPAPLPRAVPTALAAPPIVIAPPAASGTSDRHEVVAGEHLWGIAETVVRTAGRADEPSAVERYWLALCEANRDRLASGDPDLVLPGEQLDLPPIG